MWLRWLEIAIANEIDARRCFAHLVKGSWSDWILPEYRASLVAITSSAFATEAIHKGLLNMVGESWRNSDSQPVRIGKSIRSTLSISENSYRLLLAELKWLFELRDGAVHPFSDLRPTEMHPAGVATGSEVTIQQVPAA